MTESRPKKFGFSKAERLTGKKKIEELFKHGSSFFLHPLLVKFHHTDEELHRVLISVPKKKIKRAVDRNLIKRRIREAYRLNKHLVYGEQPRFFHVALIYQDNSILPYSEIEKKLIILLRRLAQKTAPNNEKS